MTAQVHRWPDGAGWYAECEPCREVWQRRDKLTEAQLDAIDHNRRLHTDAVYTMRPYERDREPA